MRRITATAALVLAAALAATGLTAPAHAATGKVIDTSCRTKQGEVLKIAVLYHRAGANVVLDKPVMVGLPYGPHKPKIQAHVVTANATTTLLPGRVYNTSGYNAMWIAPAGKKGLTFPVGTKGVNLHVKAIIDLPMHWDHYCTRSFALK